MKKKWVNLPPQVYKIKNNEARNNCRWILSPVGWVKLNFDGASRGNPGNVGIGCIINDDLGKWIVKRAKSIEPTINNLAKLKALQEGLQICLNIGIFNIIIEGDSQIVLNSIRKIKMPNWVLNSKLEEVLNILDQF